MDTGNSRRSCLPDHGRQKCVAGACWPAQTLREEETQQVTQCLLDEVLVCESILEASSVLSDRVGDGAVGLHLKDRDQSSEDANAHILDRDDRVKDVVP